MEGPCMPCVISVMTVVSVSSIQQLEIPSELEFLKSLWRLGTEEE
jgi:hypothetical protein